MCSARNTLFGQCDLQQHRRYGRCHLQKWNVVEMGVVEVLHGMNIVPNAAVGACNALPMGQKTKRQDQAGW